MLGADIAAALPEMRAMAESLMCDTVVVSVRDGVTQDPITLQDTPSWRVLYSGRGRVQRRQSQSGDANAADSQVSIDAVEVQLPWTSSPVPRGARVEVVEAAPESMAEVGMVATVREDLSKTHASKRTLACEVVGPDER